MIQIVVYEYRRKYNYQFETISDEDDCRKKMNQVNMESNKKLELTDFNVLNKETNKSHIYDIRGCIVMLDSDIAAYFGIETKALNRAMKRNINRFPEDFCFQLDRDEYRNILRYQIGT